MLFCAELNAVDDLTLHIVAGQAGIRRIDFGPHSGPDCRPDPGHPLVDEAVRQLRAYFAGELQRFDLPLDAQGTEFQKRVWRELVAIPYGKTRSYADIARRIGSARAVRAVGAANGANPIPIVVPCHRVIASDGGLGGFGGGLDMKRMLLDLEAHGVVT